MIKQHPHRAIPCECGDHYFMNLKHGYVTVFDPEDAHLTLTGTFYAQLSTTKHSAYVYCRRRIGVKKYKSVLLHREIMNAPKGIDVDHRFGNGLDNRKRHLRLATESQNSRNRRPSKNGSSKYLGVCWDKQKSRWYAAICHDYKVKYIGRFDSEIDAALAYDEQALLIGGEFARLNFPDRVVK
jgi:hypothetical protein